MADEALRRRERDAIASGDSLVMTALGIDLARVGKAREAGLLALRVASGLGDAAPVLDALVPDLDAFVVTKLGHLTGRPSAYGERAAVERLAWAADGRSLLCASHEPGVVRLLRVSADSGEVAALATVPGPATIGPIVPTAEGELWAWVRQGADSLRLVPVGAEGLGAPVWSDGAALEPPTCAFVAGGLCGAVFDRHRLRAYALRPGRGVGRTAAWKLDLVDFAVDPVGATGSGLSHARGGAVRLHLFERLRAPPLPAIVLEREDGLPLLGQVTAGRTVLETPTELRLLGRDGAHLRSLHRSSEGRYPGLLQSPAPSGWLVAFSRFRGPVELLDLRERQTRCFDLAPDVVVGSLAWSPSGRELALGTSDGIFLIAPRST